VNLGYPLNTTDNNLFYFPVDEARAYYAFVGEDSYGGRDIYKIVLEENTTASGDVVLASEPEITPEIETTPPEVLSPLPEVETMAIAVVEEFAETTEGEQEEAIQEEAIQADAIPIAIPPAEEVPELVPVEEKRVTPEEEAPVFGGAARSYTVQFMALRNPVDLTYFSGFSDISVTYSRDAWYRYTWMTTLDTLEAARIRQKLVNDGFSDSFIRRNSQIPRYTIQVMAVPGPVIDLTSFSNLAEVSVMKGRDSFCRYTTGYFETREEARENLERIQGLGYANAFVRKVKILQ
jgi:hypothetical protein